jgi:CRP-like cAMP-binding protein
MSSAMKSDLEQDRLLSQLVQFLPKETVDELICHYTSVTYAKDSIIFLQGSPADLMFWIMSGRVKLYCPMSDGDRTLVRLCGPGDVLGYADFIASDNRRLHAFEAEALTKCRMALLARERAVMMLETLDQPTLLRVIVQLNTIWSSLALSLAETLGRSFRKRLDVALKDLATRFGVKDRRGMLLPMKLSHGDLAEMINCSRPMATKLINEMVDERLLDRDGKLYIVRNTVHKNVANAATSGHRNGQKNGKGRLEPRSRVQSTFIANYPRD